MPRRVRDPSQGLSTKRLGGGGDGDYFDQNIFNQDLKPHRHTKKIKEMIRFQRMHFPAKNHVNLTFKTYESRAM